MNINAISSNRYNNTYSVNRGRITSPSFKGVINEKTANRVLDMLKPKVSSIITGSDMSALRPVIDSLIKKWNGIAKTTNSVGIMVIPNNDITSFLGKEAAKYNTIDNVGICVAVGDKYAPIETWNECYEAITVMLPKSRVSGFVN